MAADALVVDLVTKDLPAKSLVRFLILFDDSHSWFTDQAEEFLDKVRSFDINEQVATFLHACEGDAVTKLSNEKIPYSNAPIYLQNKTQIGRVDEIYGPINESLFSIKMMEGIVATSYTQGEKFFIDPAKLLPLSRFLPQPKGQSGGRGGGRGAPRGRGNFRGRGAPRGGGRGFQPRGGSRGGFRGRGRG